MEPLLSVIIATHNRPEALRRLLGDLASQTLSPDGFEVVVSDDGSAVPAEQAAGTGPTPYRLRWVRGDRAGPAAARNRALALVRGETLLFLNDDVRLREDLLQAHLALRRGLAQPAALLGTFTFTPEIRRTPLNRLVEDHGVYGTAVFPTGIPLGPLAFCTGNLSVGRREVLQIEGFDELFAEPAGEDIDLGYRLRQRCGVTLFHSRRAVVWHDHPHDLNSWRARWQLWGRALRQLAEKHGDPQFRPGGQALAAPQEAARALARLLAQEPQALELLGWLERLACGDIPPGPVRLAGTARDIYLPGQAELLMKIGLTAHLYEVQRAFWEAPPLAQ